MRLFWVLEFTSKVHRVTCVSLFRLLSKTGIVVFLVRLLGYLQSPKTFLYCFYQPEISMFLKFSAFLWSDLLWFSGRGPGGLNTTSSSGAIDVDVCGWQFYGYFNALAYCSQLREWLTTYMRDAARIVQLYRSTRSFSCGWYVVV